jgi:hypothetical protein
MHGAIPPLPNTSSWHDMHRGNFTFTTGKKTTAKICGKK